MSVAAYDKLLSNLAERCSLNDAKTLRKARELISLLNSKRSIDCSEMCKVVVCLELAAISTTVDFNREVAVKLSGCTKKNYMNNFNNISKLLNHDKIYTIKEICLLVGVPLISDTALSLFKKYQTVTPIDSSELEHAMYACAAVLAVCDAEKHPVNTQKLVDISRVKKVDLKKLSKEFSKLYEKKSSDSSEKKEKLKNDSVNRDTAPKRNEYSRDKTEEVSDEKFRDWKRRMLEDD